MAWVNSNYGWIEFSLIIKNFSVLLYPIFMHIPCIVNHEPLEEGDIEFELENCGCLRRLKNVNPNPSGLLLNETTCGINAFHRGPGQKIVGFSFYGDINSDYRYVCIMYIYYQYYN